MSAPTTALCGAPHPDRTDISCERDAGHPDRSMHMAARLHEPMSPIYQWRTHR